MANSVIFLKNKTETFTNMELEETLKWIEKYSFQLANEIEFFKEYEEEYPEEVERLLNERTLERYKGAALSLRVPFEKYKDVRDHDYEHINLLEKGLLVQSWSTLGSHLESTLQMFLSFYYRFYIESEWNVWNKEAINQIKGVITGSFSESLETIIANNADGEGLDKKIKASFINKAKYILSSKEHMPKIDKITLSDLINFYLKQRVVERDTLDSENANKIRDYRNAIHAFQERQIGSWEEYNEHIKTVIILIIDMLYRLPDIKDEEPIPYWYSAQKSEFAMKENEWLDYQMNILRD